MLGRQNDSLVSIEPILNVGNMQHSLLWNGNTLIANGLAESI